VSSPADGPSEDLLFDLEVALRMAGDLVRDLDDDVLADAARPSIPEEEAGADPSADPGSPLAPEYLLPAIVAYTYREIYSALGNLQEGRSELGQIARDRIPDTHRKLREIGDTTELAATDMLDGLDRALELVDELEPEGDGGDPAAGSGAADAGPRPASETRDALRDQLHDLISALQFQDITNQQLEFAGHLLTDMERRLSRIAANFAACFPDGVLQAVEDGAGPRPRAAADTAEPEGAGSGPRGDADAPAADAETDPAQGECDDGPVNFDPEATTRNAGERQAVADEIFTSPSTGEARAS
jgi:chemotaxis regulatin CheY-phosphate phosphatase CheZ